MLYSKETSLPVEQLSLLLGSQQKWSTATFGPGLRTKGIIKHIHKELDEIDLAPHDLTEWIDVIILALDGYWRHGGRPDTILRDLWGKSITNWAREWPTPTSEDEPVEHVREAQ